MINLFSNEAILLYIKAITLSEMCLLDDELYPDITVQIRESAMATITRALCSSEGQL